MKNKIFINNTKVRFGQRIFLPLMIFLAVGSLLLISNNWFDNRERAETEAIIYIETIAISLSGEDVLSLTATPADEGTPAYLNLKNKLTLHKEQDDNFGSIYLFAIIDNKMYFMVDSELPSSPQYTGPGVEYTEITIEELATYQNNQTVFEKAYIDSYGKWVSVITAITDFDTDTVVAYLGIDYHANGFYLDATYSSLLYSFLVFASYVAVLIL